MTTVCTPTPTLTTTVTETSTSLSTTSTTSLTTLPDSFSLTTIPCTVLPTGSLSASVCVPTVSTITIPGNTSVVTIPVTVPVDAFFTETTTLFGTACSTSIPPSVSPTVPPTTSLPPAVTNSPMNNSSSSIVPSSTDPSSVITSSSSQPPASSNTLQTAPTTSQKSNIIGPIVGGVVGGLAVLLLLGFFTLRFIKKQHRFDSIFNDKDDDKNSTTPFRKNPLESDFNPAFNYNPIGQQKAPSGITPPSSPPPGGPSTFNNAPHGRRPSITPLLGGIGGAAALDLGASNVGSSPSLYNNGGASGLSTASSRQALLAQTPMSAGNVQPQGYYPPQPQQNVGGSSVSQPMSYPPKPQPSETWNPAALYGPSTSGVTQAGYAGGLTSNPSVGSSGQQSNSSGLGYNASVGSMATGVSSWGVPSSSSSARRNSTQAGFVALGRQSQQPQPQQAPMLYTQYEDPFARSGSPVSIQEQRILQVVNAEPSSPTASSYAMQPLASSQQQQPYRVTNLSQTEQQSVGVGVSAAAGSSAEAQMGRPIKDEKSPAVHLNGALYQDPEGPSGPAPPAYQQ